MTIASEISRLQTAKSDIKTAIECKGVSVGSGVKIDCMANCILAIPDVKPGYEKISNLKMTVVGGGGGGGIGCSSSYAGTGGGGGAICNCSINYIGLNAISVTVGAGGCGFCKVYNPAGYYQATEPTGGCPSCVIGSSLSYVAKGGCRGVSHGSSHSGGASGSGCPGGSGSIGGGGGGACGAGNSCHGGLGYNGMGGGGGGFDGGRGCCGGGNAGGNCGCNATGCGGGGGAGNRCNTGYVSGKGGGGLVDICYKKTGTYPINCATGGNCCFTCDGYCVHRFTSSGTFCIKC